MEWDSVDDWLLSPDAFDAPGADCLLADRAPSRTPDPFARADTLTGGAADLPRMMQELLGAGGGRNQGGLSVSQQIQSATGWVFVAINRIREALGRVPLKFWLTGATGEDPVEVLDPRHELVSLFRNPNPMDTRSEFWGQTVTFLKLTGNSFWIKVRDGRKKVRELWVIPSQWWTPAHTKDGVLAGYDLEVGAGGKMFVPREDVVHFRQPNPRDRFWGLGTLAAASAAVKSQNAIKSSQLAVFENEILTNLYFSCEQQLQDTTFKRMISQLYERYGKSKKGRPLLMEGGVKAQFLTRTPVEMHYKDSSSITRDEILSIFGVPPLLAGIVDNANRSNSEAQTYIFEAYTVAPLCVATQERINKDLVEPDYGENLTAEFDNPVQDDRVQESEIDQTYVDGGIQAPNEVRERLGLEPEPWGVAPRWVIEAQIKVESEANALAVAEANAQAAAVKAEQDKNKQAIDVEPVDNTGDGMEPAAGEPARALQVGGPSPVRRSAGGRRAPITRAFLIRSIDSDYKALEKAVVPGLRRYFAKQAKRIQANLEEVFGPLLSDRSVETARRTLWIVTGGGAIHARLFPDGSTVQETGTDGQARLGQFVHVPDCRYLDGVLTVATIRGLDAAGEDSLDDWLGAADDLADLMTPKLEKALESGARLQSDALGFETNFDQNAPQAEAWLADKQRDYWNQTVGETTKKILSERLAEAMAEGPTLKDLKRIVEEVMGGRINSSAETIARTETVGAYNAGANVVRSLAGVSKKEWIDTDDGRTRSQHSDAGGQVVLQSEGFRVGGETLEYPGDPNGSVANIVNCRCAAVAFIEDEGEL